MSQTPPTGDIQQLLQLMARLRDREHGCPWDVQQTFASIAPYTIEEAYEVADAIDRNDLAGLRDELGDLLLQVVFHAQMAAEQGAFGFADVVATLSDKLVRRHPHVFAAQQVPDAQAVSVNWEQIKREERRAAGNQDDSALAGVARGLPEWQRSTKLQSRAARVGFDWPGPVPVLEKNCRKKSKNCVWSSHAARWPTTRPGWKTNWAMCCLFAPIWRGMPRSMSAPRCGTPI